MKLIEVTFGNQLDVITQSNTLELIQFPSNVSSFIDTFLIWKFVLGAMGEKENYVGG